MNKFQGIREALQRISEVTGLPREEVASRLSQMDRMTARLIIYRAAGASRASAPWWWSGIRDRRIGGD